MRNTADGTGGKPIAVCSYQGVRAVNSLVAFNDIYEWKGKLVFCTVLDTTLKILITFNITYIFKLLQIFEQ
jgi:hypothetical protein